MKRILLLVTTMSATVFADKDTYDRVLTAGKQNDQGVLTDIARNTENDSFVRTTAIQRLNDQALLADIAKNEKNALVRDAAVSRLNAQAHQTLLEKISRSDESLQIRLSAMSVLRDPVVLIEFEKVVYATGDAFWNRKRETVDDVPQDQGQLAEVARNDKDKCVRITAVKRLTDQAILADVAKNDKDWLVRWFAISKLDNQALLAEFAENEKDIVVRKEAAERLGLIKQNEPHPDFIGHGGTLAEIVEIIEKRRKAKQEEEEGK